MHIQGDWRPSKRAQDQPQPSNGSVEAKRAWETGKNLGLPSENEAEVLQALQVAMQKEIAAEEGEAEKRKQGRPKKKI